MDDEIRRLLIGELEKQRGALVNADVQDDARGAAARRALHSLKGSFAMAEEPALAETFGRLERRFVGGDASAVPDAERLIATALAALGAGRPIPREAWPEPPGDLVAPEVRPQFAAGYVESIQDRLARLDAALASTSADERLFLVVYREVHTIKGAALAVGDEIMAWFAHGLEAHLKLVEPQGPRRIVEEMARHRAVMAEILESPAHALATLRLLSGRAPPSVRAPIETPLPLPPKRPTLDYAAAGAGFTDRSSESRPIGDDSVRVAITTLERLYDRAAQVGQLRGPIAGNVTALERGAERARGAQASLREALRLIGPPKPWGAPAAAIDRIERCAAEAARVAQLMDRSVGQLRDAAIRVGRDGALIQATVSAMRTTQAARLFEGIAASTAAQARREGKDVTVVVTGGDTPIERRLADALADPLLQITRNSVAHGIESPEAREALGKPRTGTIELRAQLRAGSLVVEVIDDGAGVDTAEVRRSAVQSGAIGADFAERVPDRALLSLLFVPGFTTRRTVDVLAGRGVGLDLTLAAIHRLGGTIQLTNEAGRGLTSTIVVPAEGALVKVLWVESAGVVFALPLAHTRRIVRVADSGSVVVALPTLLPAAVFDGAPGAHAPKGSRLAVEVVESTTPRRGAARAFALEVDAVGEVEEVAPRALAPVIRMSGPFESAVLWGDEIRLLLDTDALVGRAHANHA
ncbi:MAG: Hpt domain-containing protein [Polyangiaceae bacterium]